MGFQRMLGIVCSKYLLAGLHGCEGSAISVFALSAFRSAVAIAVWSKKLPMTITLALLSLLDGPLAGQTQPSKSFGVFFDNCVVIWIPTFTLRFHLITNSALETFFDEEQDGWIRAGLPPLRMMSGPVEHFRSAIYLAGQSLH